jgi:hypothetical protein
VFALMLNLMTELTPKTVMIVTILVPDVLEHLPIVMSVPETEKKPPIAHVFTDI